MFADIELLIVVIPASLAFLLWRVFITNRVGPRAGITVLGLDESSETYSPPGDSRLSHYLSLPYVLTGVLTFLIGLIAYEARY